MEDLLKAVKGIMIVVFVVFHYICIILYGRRTILSADLRFNQLFYRLLIRVS